MTCIEHIVLGHQLQAQPCACHRQHMEEPSMEPDNVGPPTVRDPGTRVSEFGSLQEKSLSYTRGIFLQEAGMSLPGGWIRVSLEMPEQDSRQRVLCGRRRWDSPENRKGIRAGWC